MAASDQINAIGRRKTAVARVYMSPGSGKVIVNKKPVDQYFPLAWRRRLLDKPFNATETAGKFDVVVNARGGGVHGQLEAIVLGISRALTKYDEDLVRPLRSAGLLTRDSRMVERKKYGRPKARKRFQFSKR
ncbi:MAG: 30S ribosomal protein S9 [Rhodothermales bacterium]